MAQVDPRELASVLAQMGQASAAAPQPGIDKAQLLAQLLQAVPAPRPPLPEDQLSAEELNALKYHRKNLGGGHALNRPGGDLTTFMGAIGDLGDGKQTLIPTYWEGKVLPFPEAAQRAMKSGIAFPSYPDIETALQREKYIHDIMENDVRSHRGR